jgi:lambda repressor-like predicted transcriptional regulator
MHPAYIQAELKRRGISQSDIARKFGVSPSFVSRLIYGETSSHRVARYIAKSIDSQVHKCWPTRYHNQPRNRRAA